MVNWLLNWMVAEALEKTQIHDSRVPLSFGAFSWSFHHCRFNRKKNYSYWNNKYLLQELFIVEDFKKRTLFEWIFCFNQCCQLWQKRFAKKKKSSPWKNCSIFEIEWFLGKLKEMKSFTWVGNTGFNNN